MGLGFTGHFQVGRVPWRRELLEKSCGMGIGV